MLIKMMGALLLILACTAAGWQKTEQALRHVRVLSMLQRLIDEIQTEILYRGTALPDLLKKLQMDKTYSEIGLKYCSSLPEYRLPDSLTEMERTRLSGYFKDLGSAVGEESINHGKYYQKICAELLENAEKEAERSQQLDLKMGVCMGVLTAILLF